MPCTTADRGLPFHPRVMSLKRPTFAMCDQIKSISRKRLGRPHSATVGPDDVEAITFVLRRLIDVR